MHDDLKLVRYTWYRDIVSSRKKQTIGLILNKESANLDAVQGPKQ